MIAKNNFPTISRINELLAYNPESGLFTRIKPSGPCKAGSIAGCVNGSGYRQVNIDGRVYLEHRLAYYVTTGQLPDFVDHINGNRQDNRISNLRATNPRNNQYNRRISIVNTSGVKGVCWCNNRKKWIAHCRVNGSKFMVGRFDDIELAELALSEFRNKYHGDFARHK